MKLSTETTLKGFPVPFPEESQILFACAEYIDRCIFLEDYFYQNCSYRIYAFKLLFVFFLHWRGEDKAMGMQASTLPLFYITNPRRLELS